MDPLFAQVDAREKGTQIPVSIATALAVESSLGIMPENETPNPPIRNVDTLWVNLRTLFRNLNGAMPKEAREAVTPDVLAEILVNEMQIIEAAVSQGARGRVMVSYYVCSLSSLNRQFPFANHRSPKTPLQRQAWALEQATIRTVMDSNPPYDVQEFDLAFPAVDKRAFIITHHAVGLLNRYRFRSLTLLESHTGALKPPVRYYTKLYNGKELVNMPFDRMTLQLFGDGALFGPMQLKIRKHMEEISKKYKWSAMTTQEYVMSSVRRERDPVLEAFILRLY